MSGELDPMTADDGAMVFTALVKPNPDGSFLLCVIVVDGEKEEERVWVSQGFTGPAAAAVTREIAFWSGAGRA